jgi:hypothetical protein
VLKILDVHHVLTYEMETALLAQHRHISFLAWSPAAPLVLAMLDNLTDSSAIKLDSAITHGERADSPSDAQVSLPLDDHVPDAPDAADGADGLGQCAGAESTAVDSAPAGEGGMAAEDCNDARDSVGHVSAGGEEDAPASDPPVTSDGDADEPAPAPAPGPGVAPPPHGSVEVLPEIGIEALQAVRGMLGDEIAKCRQHLDADEVPSAFPPCLCVQAADFAGCKAAY